MKGIMLIKLVGVLTICISCDSQVEEISIHTEMEQLVVNNWQFDRIEVNDVWIGHVSPGFDPSSKSFSAFIPWFWFSYSNDLSYDFRSDADKIPYGLEDNYQPQYGYWQLIEEQNLLIHNPGMPYETSYRIIELNDTLFVREYDRIIYQSPDTTIWPIGEMAVYREVLEKRKGSCC